MCARQREMADEAKRRAPDGEFYTRREFQQYFGSLDEWAAAAPPVLRATAETPKAEARAESEDTAEAAENASRRAAEFEALQAIYADLIEGDAAGPWRITLEGASAALECYLPDDYPSSSPPTPVLHAPALSEHDCTALASELVALYDGAEVVYTWAEHCREQLADGTDAALSAAAQHDAELSAAMAVAAVADADDMADEAAAVAAAETAAAEAAAAEASGLTFTPSTSRYGQRMRHLSPDATDPTFEVEITSGPSFHPPKSGPSEEFQAHVASVSCMGQVHWVLARLLSDKRIARATHNMLAYRFMDERGVHVSDNDDDGESSSGAKLAALLELTSVSNVLVVVSRWFGGVHLGPARFKYIASTARNLLEETGRCSSGGGGGGKAKKR